MYTRAHDEADLERGNINLAYVSVARRLRENGYSPIPLSGKQPRTKGWQKAFCERLPSVDEIDRDWSFGRLGRSVMDGVGVANAGGVLIIDVDDGAAVEAVLSHIPKARLAPTCIGRRGCKLFVRSLDLTNRQEWNLTGSSTNGVLEILAWHRQGVIPPTVHPETGRPYRWVDENCSLLTIPVGQLPIITHKEILTLHAAFVVDASGRTSRRSKSEGHSRTLGDAGVDAPPHAETMVPPPGWWQSSPNRAQIENLARGFGIVHRAALKAGGRIVMQRDGYDSSGKPHRQEIIDIDNTAHWKIVVRIIVAELGLTDEAYWLHVEVSKGNELLGLPGGPSTYDEVGNRRFYNRVVDPMTFANRSGKRPRTRRTLQWWVSTIEGRQPTLKAARKKSLVKPFWAAVARLRARDLQASTRRALLLADARFGAGSFKLRFVREAVGAVGWYGGAVGITNIRELADRHGVSVRAVQLAITDAEGAAILIRTRGNEGGKAILLTVPAVIEPPAANFNEDVQCSPSLHSGYSGLSGDQEAKVAAAATEGAQGGDHDADEYDWDDWEDPPSPFGDVRVPSSAGEIDAMNRYMVEVRQGKCTEETLFDTGILPHEALYWLLQIVEAIARGKRAGAQWLRHIAHEAGELVLRESEAWPRKLQLALDYVEPRLAKKKGRATPCKWAQTFAENLGYENDRAGRSTPMARRAQRARQRWEQKQQAGKEGGTVPE